MPGALVHIATGLVSAIIVYFIMRQLEFSLSIFIGNLLPDVLKMIYLAFYYQSLNMKILTSNYLHVPIQAVVNAWEFILFFFSFFFALAWLLYHFHYIKKRKLTEYDELILYLAIGYIMHIILDATLKRTGIWI